MNYKERLKDYLDGYSSQYNFKDKNGIEHDLDSDIEEMLKQNQKLEQALDDIKKICNSIPKEHSICDIGKIHDIERIIQKAKGDVKNENDFLLSVYTEFGERNNDEIVEFLNDYVEIIEEPKKIGKITIDIDEMILNGYKCMPEQLFNVAHKVNELIDEINNLKEND